MYVDVMIRKWLLGAIVLQFIQVSSILTPSWYGDGVCDLVLIPMLNAYRVIQHMNDCDGKRSPITYMTGLSLLRWSIPEVRFYCTFLHSSMTTRVQ